MKLENSLSEIKSLPVEFPSSPPTYTIAPSSIVQLLSTPSFLKMCQPLNEFPSESIIQSLSIPLRVSIYFLSLVNIS